MKKFRHDTLICNYPRVCNLLQGQGMLMNQIQWTCRIFWCYVSVCQQLLLQGVCSIDANINSGNYYIDLLWLSVIFDVIFGRHTVNTVLISGGEIWLPYYSNTVIYWFWFLRIKISTRLLKYSMRSNWPTSWFWYEHTGIFLSCVWLFNQHQRRLRTFITLSGLITKTLSTCIFYIHEN